MIPRGLDADAIEDFKGAAVTDSFIAPVPLERGPGSGSGLSDETIILHVLATGQHTIDGSIGAFEDSGPDYRQVPFRVPRDTRRPVTRWN